MYPAVPRNIAPNAMSVYLSARASPVRSAEGGGGGEAIEVMHLMRAGDVTARGFIVVLFLHLNNLSW